MTWNAKVDVNPAELKKVDDCIAQVEAQKKDSIFRLGESFYNANKDNKELGEVFLSQVELLNKLEYNRRVWLNRKMKMQGMRVCENCGNILPYDSVFCNKCGNKLAAVAEELLMISEYPQ